MIKKDIKEYKQRNDTIQRINILKKDNIKGTVYILGIDEHEKLKKELKTLKETIAKQDHELNQVIIKQDTEIKELYSNNKDIKESNDELQEKIELLDTEHQMLEKRNDKLSIEITELLRQNKSLKKDLSNINELTNKFNEIIKSLDKQHNEELKDSYDKFNAKLTKYIITNQLQNTALKQILELGFIDLLRNKHKKIANDKIKELESKPVYELTKK